MVVIKVKNAHLICNTITFIAWSRFIANTNLQNSWIEFWKLSLSVILKIFLISRRFKPRWFSQNQFWKSAYHSFYWGRSNPMTPPKNSESKGLTLLFQVSVLYEASQNVWGEFLRILKILEDSLRIPRDSLGFLMFPKNSKGSWGFLRIVWVKDHGDSRDSDTIFGIFEDSLGFFKNVYEASEVSSTSF